MFGNYAASALRHLSRNKLYNTMTVVGLAVGFAVAMLAALYVRDEVSYDRFVPDAARILRVSETHQAPGERPVVSDTTSALLGRKLKLAFPEIELVARLNPSGPSPTVRRGAQTSKEFGFIWADPDFFRIIGLPTLAGDLPRALDAPDGLVITRAIARKYFGRDTPIGETLLIDGRPMRINAVIEDLPSNTHLAANMYGSALSASGNMLYQEKVDTPLNETVATYIKLRPGASAAAVTRRLPAFAAEHFSAAALGIRGARMSFELVPLRDIHLRRADQGAFKPSGDRTVNAAIAGVGGLVLLVAAINFITLMTARATRRAVEVGVRKAVGAQRRQLIAQFMGEAMAYVTLAGVAGVALAEVTLPAFNAILSRQIAFHYLTDARLFAGLIATILLTGVLAGAYPALVLSSFRPSAVLRGGPIRLGGAAARQALVVAQFAVLACLILFAVTLTRQTLFGLNGGMRLNKDNVSLLSVEPCTDQLRDAMLRVPGVQQAACASAQVMGLGVNPVTATLNGREARVFSAPVDYDFFKVYAMTPLAGRFFDRSRPADGFFADSSSNPPVVINEAAVRKLGFATPAAAIGQRVVWSFHTDLETPYGSEPKKPSEIIGVVPDFTFGSMREPIRPTFYSLGPKVSYYSMVLNLLIDPNMSTSAGQGIEAVWRRAGNGGPPQMASVKAFTLRLYLDMLAQGATIVIAALIAILVACLGLFALSAYTTEQRTREIGIRKAMGARSSDIVRLLLWQFTKPVLWANLLAAPVAFGLLSWWLSGFAYHVGVAPWTFVAAVLASLIIAWATVLFHSIRVARARPVRALRYE
jgi:putative ABC transport system permease protein